MHILTENIGWKLLSLVIAFALWANYVAESDVATSIVSPLLLRSAPHDLEISNDVPDRVDLHVRGPERQMTSANLAQADVTLDLGGVTSPGEQTFTLGDKNVHLPPGVKLVNVVPSQVTMKFERRVVREVPVQPRYIGEPPAGYTVSAQDVAPVRVRIAGPESRVNTVKFVATDPIDLSGIVGQKEFRAPISVADPHVRLEHDDPAVVRVTVEKTGARD